jgi:hypothetical protein
MVLSRLYPIQSATKGSDPVDYSGAVWIVIGVLVAAVLIVLGTPCWFRATARSSTCRSSAVLGSGPC